MCLCLCEMHVKAVHGYVYLCIKFVSNRTKSLTLFLVVKNFHQIPQDMKYFTTNNFHMKISNSECYPKQQ